MYFLILILGFTPVQDSPEIKELAMLINSEAEGEPYEGKLAVGQIVLNRAHESGLSIPDIIHAKGQFDGVKTKRFKITQESLQAAREIMCGRVVLPNDYLYFCNPKTSTDSKWVAYLKSFPNEVRIGNHVFFQKPTISFKRWKRKQSGYL